MSVGQMCQNIHTGRTMLCLLTQPDSHLCCVRINRPHDHNLVTPFTVVVLVDAYYIDTAENSQQVIKCKMSLTYNFHLKIY
jgi:hypothetical protein